MSRAHTARPDTAKLSAARLAAVQALYSMEITGVTAAEALDEAHARDGDVGELPQDIAKADADLLAQLVRGASAELAQLDEIVTAGLSADWTVDRLEAILRAILRVGIWELKNRLNTPARVIVSEYVDLARAFYAGTEPNLVNAVLDRLARVLRPNEFEPGNNGRRAG